jgi:hypothetical protein
MGEGSRLADDPRLLCDLARSASSLPSLTRWRRFRGVSVHLSTGTCRKRRLVHTIDRLGRCELWPFLCAPLTTLDEIQADGDEGALVH